MTLLLLDGLLYAAMAATMTLGGREYRLINLSAGVWIVLGGWFASQLLGMEGTAFIRSTWLFALAALILAIQACSPLLIGKRLRDHPSSYLMISLGSALAVGSLSNWLLTESRAEIPQSHGEGGLLVAATGCVAAMCVPPLIRRSRWWATGVLRFRSNTTGGAVAASAILSIEAILLILLGACTIVIHRSQFGMSEARTIVPVLALAATKSDGILGPVLAGAPIVLAYAASAVWPGLQGYELAIVAASLAVTVVFRVTTLGHMRLKRIATLPRAQGIAGPWGLILSACLFVVILAVLIETDGLSADLVQSTARTMAIVTIAWLAIRYAGISSAAWLAIAGVFLLSLSYSINSPLDVFPLVFAMGAWATYLVFLRLAPSSLALLIDLAVVIVIFQLHRNAFLGPHGVVVLNGVEALSASPGAGLIYQGSLFASILGLVVYLHNTSRGRVIVGSLAMPELGRSHALGSLRNLAGAAVVLGVAGLVSGIIYHSTSPALPLTEFSLVKGVTVFFMGYIAHMAGLPLALSGVFLISSLESVLRGAGAAAQGVTGLGMMLLGIFGTYGDD